MYFSKLPTTSYWNFTAAVNCMAFMEEITYNQPDTKSAVYPPMTGDRAYLSATSKDWIILSSFGPSSSHCSSRAEAQAVISIPSFIIDLAVVLR
mmetsp:Transcript_33763/g.42565  ORF Transcript_33763/g.42565 Transcript_33763/m.42565 type:complete len:94 (+) Transcript_33763:320-601(+)